jgi:hypothetical protein
MNPSPYRLNPPNTVKLSKNNVKNMGVLPKAAPNIGPQPATQY